MLGYPAAGFVSAYTESEMLVQSHGTDLESMSIVVPMFVNLHVRDFELSWPAIHCQVGKLWPFVTISLLRHASQFSAPEETVRERPAVLAYAIDWFLMYRILHKCTDPRQQDARATKLRTVTPNISVSSVWNLLHVTQLAPRIWGGGGGLLHSNSHLNVLF